MKSISGDIDYEKSENRDVPEGTITTEPYYSDLMIPVVLKEKKHS